jgi:TonB family protein
MPASLLLSLALPAAADPAPVNDEVLAINPADVGKLWTLGRGDREAETFGDTGYRAGCASLSYIIESSGRVSSIKVLRAWPAVDFGNAAARMMKTWQFEPTRNNAQRQAIYTIHTFTFTTPSYEGEVGTHRKPKVDLEKVFESCAIKEVQLGG